MDLFNRRILPLTSGAEGKGNSRLILPSPPRFEEGRHSRKKVTFAKPIGVKKTSFLPSDEGMAGGEKKASRIEEGRSTDRLCAKAPNFGEEVYSIG